MTTDTPNDSSPKRPLWRRIAKLLAKLVVFAVLMMVLMQVLGSIRAPDLPEQAPEFALLDRDGQVAHLSDFRGKLVVLNFWASWCMPCRLEIPSFSRFARANPDVEVIGISSDGNVQSMGATADDLGIDYSVLLGDRATLEAYDISTYPTTVIVSSDGHILSAYTGIMLDPHLAWATRSR